jgi:hypothetical protein
MGFAFPLRWQTFRLWKRGNAADDYEDASGGDVPSGRFAVADGASEASFAAAWARLLVEQFLVTPGKPWRDLDWLGPLRRQWARQVDELVLPWYAEEKRELGAFATFLGLAFRPSSIGPHGYWRALAVGDCCLFHARDNRLVQPFPLTRSTDFGNRPRLLASRPGPRPGPEEVNSACEQAHGHWQPRDRFLLTTDALAQWFLLRSERGHQPLAEVDSLLAESDPPAAFVGWVDERRNQELLRNDDVTLIVIDVASE